MKYKWIDRFDERRNYNTGQYERMLVGRAVDFNDDLIKDIVCVGITMMQTPLPGLTPIFVNRWYGNISWPDFSDPWFADYEYSSFSYFQDHLKMPRTYTEINSFPNPEEAQEYIEEHLPRALDLMSKQISDLSEKIKNIVFFKERL